MNGHPQFDEDFDLYALGALDAQERAGMQSHLEGCIACSEKLAEARRRLALAALSVPEVRPPEHIKRRLMDRIHRESAAAIPSVREQKPSRFALWLQPAFAWTCAACIAVVASILAFHNSRLQQTLDAEHQQMLALQNSAAHDRTVSSLLTGSDTQRVLLTQAADSSRPEARVYYHPSRGMLFYATNLPVAPNDRVYQLWLVPSQGSPISAGVFQPNPKGEASIILPTLPTLPPGVTAKAFAVTLEPAGGVPQPTGPKILVGAPA